jgi:hypothetical protein
MQRQEKDKAKSSGSADDFCAMFTNLVRGHHQKECSPVVQEEDLRLATPRGPRADPGSLVHRPFLVAEDPAGSSRS